MPLDGLFSCWVSLIVTPPDGWDQIDTFISLATILESYILLGRGVFLERHAKSLSLSIEAVWPQITEKFERLLLAALDTFALLYPSELMNLLPRTIHQMERDMMARDKKEDQTVVCYLAIFSRLLCGQFDQTIVYLTSRAALSNVTVDKYLDYFFELFIEKADCASSVDKRKLFAVAMLKSLPLLLLTSTEKKDAHLSGVLNVVLGVMSELELNETKEYVADMLSKCGISRATAEAERTELQRLVLLWADDPVNSADLKQLTMSTLDQCNQTIGAEQMQILIKTLDKYIHECIHDMLTKF